MKRTMSRRWIFTIISIMLMMSIILPTLASASEELEAGGEYGEIIFGEKLKQDKLSVKYSNGYTAVNKGGRYGWKSSKATGGYHIFIDIDDDFMYDLPDGTPVDVTVEYYDAVADFNTKFIVKWESHTPYDPTRTYPEEFSREAYLTHSGEWKSHTFRIDSMKATNGLQYKADLIIQIYNNLNYQLSAEDIVFGSVKIEPVISESPVYVKNVVPTETGGLYSAESEIEFETEVFNHSDEEVTVTYRGDIANSYGDLTGAFEHSFELEPNEKRTERFKIENPVTRDCYDLIGTSEVVSKSAPDEVKYGEEWKAKFSVSKLFEAGEGSSKFGVNHRYLRANNDAEEVTEIMNKLGAGYMRETIDWLLVQPQKGGPLKLDERHYEWRQSNIDAGVEDVLVFMGSNNSYLQGMPITDEDQKAYAEYCAYVAKELDCVKYFTIWNEPNIHAFNTNDAPPEAYANLIKRTYTAIKNVRPDAQVIMLETAAAANGPIDMDYVREFFEYGVYDYCDIIAVHPYDWSGHFRQQIFIDGVLEFKEFLKQYGDPKPIWITELGFTRVDKKYRVSGMSDEEAAQNFPFVNALIDAYDLFDNFIMYEMYDGLDPTDKESWWGVLRNWDETREEFPNTANHGFLSVTAYFEFIPDDAEFKEVINDGEAYAFRFYNKQRGKDVLMLQTGEGSQNMNLDLGCNSVEVYDIYGNYIDTVVSDSGIYGFVAERNPIYVLGSFTKFEQTDLLPDVEADAVSKDAPIDDSVTFNFTKNIDKELNISVEGAEVLQNTGFVEGCCSVKIKVPVSDKEQMRFKIKVADSDGMIFYSRYHTINITEPVTVTIKSEEVQDTDGSRWRVRTTVKNMANENYVSGTVKITQPKEAGEINSVKRFSRLEANEEITYIFNLPKKMTKSLMDISAEIKLDNGYVTYANDEVCFSSAVYAETKPQIDGVIAVNEWNGSWVGANEDKDYVKLTYDRTSGEDLSFSGTMLWDEENFYFVAAVTDDVHSTQYEPATVGDMWRGDGIQIGLDDRVTVNTIAETEFTELTIGCLPDGTPAIQRGRSLYINKLSVGEVTNAEYALKRYDTYTVYECKIPWSEIFYEGYEVRPDDPFRMSLLVNDNDGHGRKGYIEYCSGIGTGKNVTKFGEMTFKK